MRIDPRRLALSLRRILIVAKREIRDQFRRGGGLTLREEGVLLAIAGRTSLEEVLRVTQTDESMDEPLIKPSAHKEAA